MERFKIKRLISFFVYLILFGSISLNVCFIYKDTDRITKYVLKLFSPQIKPDIYWKIEDTNFAFINSVINKSMALSEEERFDSKMSGIYYDWSEAYNLVGLSYYALEFKDEKTKKFVINYADKLINQNSGLLNYELENITQYPIGLFFINTYKITKNKKYKYVVDDIYNSLKTLSSEDGHIQFRFKGEDYCFVDALGMYIPFLMEYYNLTQKREALELSLKNIDIYKKFGCDKDTGLPCHGYDKETGIKMGSINWGRGIGWYLLALSFCPNYSDTLLNNTISKLPYTQFPCVKGSRFDTSTALMFEIYKQSRNVNRIPELLEIKVNTTKDGLIGRCSGDTKGFNRYSESFIKSEFCNGFLLILISKFMNYENRSGYILEH